MFQGHSICTLDSKSRIVFPSKFRKNITPSANNKIKITRGMDKCLLVYPQDAWELIEGKLKKLNILDPKKRFFLRQFMMYAEECEIDSQNRILIPSHLINYAEIKNEILIIGLIDKLEMWSPEVKADYDKKQEYSYEDVAKMLSDELNEL